jgi:hypothetical protein
MFLLKEELLSDVIQIIKVALLNGLLLFLNCQVCHLVNCGASDSQLLIQEIAEFCSETLSCC